MCQGQSTPYIGELNHPTFNDGNPYNVFFEPLRNWVDEFNPYYMVGVQTPHICCTLGSPLHPGCQLPPRILVTFLGSEIPTKNQLICHWHLGKGVVPSCTFMWNTCQWLLLVPLIGVEEDVVSFKLYIVRKIGMAQLSEPVGGPCFEAFF